MTSLNPLTGFRRLPRCWAFHGARSEAIEPGAPASGEAPKDPPQGAPKNPNTSRGRGDRK